MSSLDLSWEKLLAGQRSHKLNRLQAHRNHLSDQSHDVFRIVDSVGIVGYAAAFVGADLILIDDPVERGAIAQPILKHFRGG